MKGIIYILSNSSMPDVVKIGKTTTSPTQRMKELNSTGVPTPFELEFAVEVADCDGCERAAHEVLDEHRVSTNREFFRVSARRAITEILPELGDYALLHVKDSYGIEKIEADLRKRREEQQAIVRAQEAKRAGEQRERARAKAQRVAELHQRLASARARLSALGPRPVEPHTSWLTTLLMLCWVPVPFGWLVWLGSLSAFLGPKYEVGYVCIALLVAGFIANQACNEAQAAHSKAIEPFLPIEQEVKDLETAIKNENASPVSPPSPAPDAIPERPSQEVLLARVVIPCPKCEQRMRLPANKTLEATCPSCGLVFKVKT